LEGRAKQLCDYKIGALLHIKKNSKMQKKEEKQTKKLDATRQLLRRIKKVRGSFPQ
jgi:hypothetical protein